jgi:hypothetical protein
MRAGLGEGRRRDHTAQPGSAIEQGEEGVEFALDDPAHAVEQERDQQGEGQ